MKTVTINNREYQVGYAREIREGVWSLGLKGKRGAYYMTDYDTKTGNYSKLISV